LRLQHSQGGRHLVDALDGWFHLKERNTTVSREVVGGITTFVTLSYIVFVQPAMLSAAGMPPGGVLFATCIGSAIACLLMGLLANYPIALAPAMGHNAYFTFVVCGAAASGGLGLTWQQALAANLISGCLFVALSFFHFRAKIMDVIPDNLKRAIAGGIGLFIALIGFEYAGMVKASPATLIQFGSIHDKYTLLAIFGLLVTMLLMALNVRGAILLGMLATTVAGCLATALGNELLDYTNLKRLGGLNPSATFLKFDFNGLFSAKSWLSVVLVLLFLDVFDTVGTLSGVSEQAGLLVDGKLPKAKWALFSDAVGTVAGASLGTSTITSYIESAAGIQAGARTGLAAVVTAVCFPLALLAYPLLGIVARPLGTGGNLYPVIAPALIVVGSMMLSSVVKLDWTDPTETLPAFLTLVFIPFAFNITEGIAIGFISYSVLKFATGRWREAHWGFHLVSLALVLRYVFLAS
jgi:AGZA family xanthine/uracil permease-like MFS transporter